MLILLLMGAETVVTLSNMLFPGCLSMYSRYVNISVVLDFTPPAAFNAFMSQYSAALPLKYPTAMGKFSFELSPVDFILNGTVMYFLSNCSYDFLEIFSAKTPASPIPRFE